MSDDVNIIILDAYESFITYLNPEQVEIVETNKKGTQRSIKITYPLERDINGDETINEWFQQGNKIFIPSALGVSSCLYVINTDISIDFWEKNDVVVNAEEVLVELNYLMFEYVDLTPLTINKTNLNKWFGEFYSIGIIDSLTKGKNTITPAGTITLMSLLRLIEDETEYIFTTEYTLENNKINRVLNLRKPENAGVTQPDYLNLNRNVESLELEVDESNTYNAMAPILSLSNTVTTTNTITSNNITSTNTQTQNATGNDSTNRDELKKVLETWKSLDVQYRESIPMIIEKSSDGTIIYEKDSYWYAPFVKPEGSLYIYDPIVTTSNYTSIVPRYDKNNKIVPHTKCGTVNTNETDKYSIYNTLARALLKKRTPSFTVKVNLKDVQLLLGKNNLGYSLHDTLYVKIPGFDYYVESIVTETKKNFHMPGENTITLESNVGGTHWQDITEIKSNDIIVPSNQKVLELGGNLVDSKEEGVDNETVTINIQLVRAYDADEVKYTDIEAQLPSVYPFKPESEYYVFSDNEVQNMAGTIKNYIINNNWERPNTVNMKTVTGKVYRVPYDWCRAIYSARNQYQIYTSDYDENGVVTNSKVSPGSFAGTIEVHYYNNIFDILKQYSNENIKNMYYMKYWACAFYQMQLDTSSYAEKQFKISGNNYPVTSNDHQNESDCGPTAFSNATESLWDYHTEYEMVKFYNVGTEGLSSGGIAVADFDKIKQLKYDGFWVDATWSNILKYIHAGSTIIFSVNPTLLSYVHQTYNEDSSHAVQVNLLFNTKSQNIVFVEDTNFPVFTPYNYPLSDEWKEHYIKWSELYDAINICQVKGNNSKFYNYQKNSSLGNKRIKKMYVVRLSRDNITDVIDRSVAFDTDFNPALTNYTFDGKEIQRAYKHLIQDVKKEYPNVAVDTYPCTITDSKGTIYTTTGKWVQAMMYEYIYQYIDNSKTSSNLILNFNYKTTGYWYYNVKGTVYDWTTIINDTAEISKTHGYAPIILITSLYYLGTFLSLQDFDNNYPHTSEWAYKDIIQAVNKIDKNINCFIVDRTEENFRRYARTSLLGSVILLNVTCSNNEQEIERISNGLVNDYGMYMVYSCTGDSLNYQTPFGVGNGPNYCPRVPATDNSAKTNPFFYDSIKKVLTRCKYYDDNFCKYPDMKGKMLVLSIWTQSELMIMYHKPVNTLTVDTTHNTPIKTITNVIDTSKFDPVNNYYTFRDSEIKNMAQVVVNYKIQHNSNPSSVNMKTTSGDIVKVPWQWVRAIWYTRNQYYETNDEGNKIGTALFSDTIQVHDYGDSIIDKIKKNEIDKRKVIYWPSWFYYLINRERKYIYDNYFKNTEPNTKITFDPVTSTDIQTNGDCVPTAFSNATETLFHYKTETETKNKFDTKEGGTDINKLSKASTWGFNIFWVEATWSNLKKYSTATSVVNGCFWAKNLPYLGVPKETGAHAQHVHGCFEAGNKKYVMMENTWGNEYEPGTYPNSVHNLIITWDTFYYALKDCYVNGESGVHGTDQLNGHTMKYKVLTIIQLTKSQVKSTQDRAITTTKNNVTTTSKIVPTETVVTVDTSKFDPVNNSYTFTKKELQNMADTVMNYKIQHNSNPSSVNMKTTSGDIVKVPWQWVRAIWYTRNQYYIKKDASEDTNKLGKGVFPEQLIIHDYSSMLEKFFIDRKLSPSFEKWDKDYNLSLSLLSRILLSSKKQWEKYIILWPTWFYYLINAHHQIIYNKYYKNTNPSFKVTLDSVSSADSQTGGDCADVAFSNCSEDLFNYKTEKEARIAFKTRTDGTAPEDFQKGASSFGFKAFWVEATWNNIQKYNTASSSIFGGFDLQSFNEKEFPYATKEKALHAMHISGGFSVNNKKYVLIENSYGLENNPLSTYDSDDTMLPVSWESIYKALYIESSSKNKLQVTSSRSSKKYKMIFVVQLQKSQLKHVEPRVITQKITTSTNTVHTNINNNGIVTNNTNVIPNENARDPFKYDIPTKNGVPDVNSMKGDYTFEWVDYNQTYTLTKEMYQEVFNRDSKGMQLNNYKMSKYTAFRTENKPHTYHVIKRERWNALEECFYCRMTFVNGTANATLYYPHEKKLPDKIIVNFKNKTLQAITDGSYSSVWNFKSSECSYYFCADHQDTVYTCGPTSLSQITQYLHKYVSEEVLQDKIHAHNGVGSAPSTHVSVMKQLGFNAVENTSFSSLIRHLKSGKPATVHAPDHYIGAPLCNSDASKILILNSTYSKGYGPLTGWASRGRVSDAMGNKKGVLLSLNWKISNDEATRIKHFFNSMGGVWNRKENYNEQIRMLKQR